MNASSRSTITISIESKIHASTFFEFLKDTLSVPSTAETVEFANELYFTNDDDLLVQISMEFGDNDGAQLLFEDSSDEDGYVNPHSPYAEATISILNSYTNDIGGHAVDLGAAILTKTAEWLEEYNVEWGYYTDFDKSGRWLSGEFPAYFGNPEKIDLEKLDSANLV